ncbi:hypothetical protein M0805_006979 [Coniferiporia weirii]|nr:hypothetical protein M0805_006979 [Coniferiporia weirii]
MGQFSGDIISLVGRAAAEQAGIISGDNPAQYNSADPLRLWVIQVAVIVIFTQLLSLLLGRIRQPRVIAEVIGGVLLGPSVMGRIPHFTDSIFPKDSIPLLSLTANIGLVFFLFLVGLEIDTSSVRNNVRPATLISVAGLVLPLGLGAAIAVPLYHAFIEPTVNFGDFILFVAVAIGITAFPVLCRILTELHLLDTPVGVITLAAGVGNDVVGWILLALAVALVNSASGLTALWVLLAATGYVILLLFPGRWALHWLARKTGSLEGGQPSMLMMTVTLLLVLVSAFFTDIIGIHAIFGGFVAGLIIPHEGGFAIALVEKLEDLITLIFLPLYFVLSGLSTDLGLLDTGKTWGYVVLICVVAFFGKFIGCFVTAKLLGFNLRESGAIGTLMSCKGLVELIVLNVGLNAGILDTRTFSMFVLHALVLTFMTTPLTLLWYPAKHRTRVDQVNKDVPEEPGPLTMFEDMTKTNFAVVLNKVEHLPAVMTLTQLLQRPFLPPAATDTCTTTSIQDGKVSELTHTQSPVQLSALRLIELTERTSTVLRSQEAVTLAYGDPLLSVVRACGRLHRLPVSGALAVVPTDEFAQRVAGFVRERAAQIVVLPWTLALAAPGLSTGTPNNTEEPGTPGSSSSPIQSTAGPFDSLFAVGSNIGSTNYSSFVRKVFAESPADVALFVERAPDASAQAGGGADGYHLFLPFFGGADDRLALELVVQLCANPAVTATVVRVQTSDPGGGELERLNTVEQEKIVALANYAQINTDTIYDAHTTHTRLASDVADNLLWARYARVPSPVLPAHVHEALSRIAFRDASSTAPTHALRTVLAGLPAAGGGNVIVVAGRARRAAREAHRAELRTLLAAGHEAGGEELSRTVGYVGAAFLLAQGAATRAGAVLVVQSVEGLHTV